LLTREGFDRHALFFFFPLAVARGGSAWWLGRILGSWPVAHSAPDPYPQSRPDDRRVFRFTDHRFTRRRARFTGRAPVSTHTCVLWHGGAGVLPAYRARTLLGSLVHWIAGSPRAMSTDPAWILPCLSPDDGAPHSRPTPTRPATGGGPPGRVLLWGSGGWIRRHVQ